jgi:hypothetical protein
MAKRKRIKQQTMVNKTRYTENYRTNLTENLEWSWMLRRTKQFLIH